MALKFVGFGSVAKEEAGLGREVNCDKDFAITMGVEGGLIGGEPPDPDGFTPVAGVAFH